MRHFADRMNRPQIRSLVFTFLAWLFCAASTTASAERAQTTLERIQARGSIICGFTRTSRGFSTVDARGVWSGFDVDFCRALAAATLGNPDAIKPLSIAPSAVPAALTSGEIDILATGTAISLSREIGLGIRFPGVLYHDALSLLVKRAQGVTSARELSGASICIGNNPEAIQALGAFFKSYGIRHEPVIVEKGEEIVQAYTSGRCQVLCADAALLADLRARLSTGEHHILPEALAITMLGPSIRRGDPAWYDIVRWAIHALVTAEQLGITSARAEGLKASSPQLEVRRLLGAEGDIGKPLGLKREWVYQMVKSIGNYAEMFDRNLGQRSALKLDRRVNELWNKGGLMVAPLLR